MTLLIIGVLTLVRVLIFIPKYKLPFHKETLSLSGYIPIFKLRPLMLLIASFIFFFIPYWIFAPMSPVLYIKDLDVSLAHFGYYQGALAMVFAIGCLILGCIVSKLNQLKMLYISSFVTIFGLITIILVTYFNSHNSLVITLAFLPFIIGQIVPSTILFPVCLNILPQAKGKVSAIIQGGRLIIAAISFQFAGYYYNGSFQNIGIIIVTFIFLSIISLRIALRNQQIIKGLP